jgi:hypothetical protein
LSVESSDPFQTPDMSRRKVHPADEKSAKERMIKTSDNG